jgi:hypothetical protein
MQFIITMLFSLYALASPKSPSLENQVRKAPLIFFGEVVKVEYKNSSASQQHPRGLPHTFVTYKVLTPVFGKTEGLFTLRFLGGAYPDGTVMDLSHFPTFDVGEKDVLLIQGNANLACPLMGCAAGRLRVSNGKVFTEEGRVLRKGRGNNSFAYGSFQSLPEVTMRTIVNPRTNAKAVLITKGESEPPKAPEADQLKVTDLLGLISKLKAGQQPGLIPSADIRNDIPGIDLRAVAPPAAPPARVIPPKDAEEINEQKMVDAAGGNPVLKQ